MSVPLLLLLVTLAFGASPTVGQVRGAVYLPDGLLPRTTQFDEGAWEVLVDAIKSGDPGLRKAGLTEAARALHVWRPPAKVLLKLDKAVSKLDEDEGGWPATNLRWMLQNAAADHATRMEQIETRLTSKDPVQQQEALALLMVHRGEGTRELLDETKVTWSARGKHADVQWIDGWLARLDGEAALEGLDNLERARHLKEAIDAELTTPTSEPRAIYLRWLVLTLGATDDQRVAGWLRTIFSSDSRHAQLAAQAAMLYRGELSKPAITR